MMFLIDLTIFLAMLLVTDAIYQMVSDNTLNAENTLLGKVVKWVLRKKNQK